MLVNTGILDNQRVTRFPIQPVAIMNIMAFAFQHKKYC